MHEMTTKYIHPLLGQKLTRVDFGEEYDARGKPLDVDRLEDANGITSRVIGKTKAHKLLIDLDLPAKLIPSSTEGHFHLYIDHEIEEAGYFALLEALEAVGIIQTGYLEASKSRGFTQLRLPWVKKGDVDPRCAECHKSPLELVEYDMIAEAEGYDSAIEACIKEEGTYNPATGAFWCNKCYIAIGQPLGKA